MKPTIHQLRAYAISHSLFRPTTLRAAVDRLGFVQADPIRAPARAHDLILRHRVSDYRAGDLERHYAELELEEDFLYAYGFLTKALWLVVRRRTFTGLPEFEKKVLTVVRRQDLTHPKDLVKLFGSERRTNNWGGYSRATKLALEDLHERGLVRIAGRENGIRIYQAARLPSERLSERERLRRLLLAVVDILAPVSERTLREAVRPMRHLLAAYPQVLDSLVSSGALKKEVLDKVSYLLPGQKKSRVEREPSVRFLAPFDPLVWDRRRFEHFWGWPYRFEAYVPPAKRLRGYYAMPLLWGETVVGWANVSVAGGDLNVELGFVEKRPREKQFRLELDVEIARIQTFLNLKKRP
ncbi:MAG: DNA glycosylase AlkZ-like family protein [Pyrinomonadaceae bacterium]